MNWAGFIIMVFILSLVGQSLVWSAYNSNPEKEVPCYDEHNNQIKDLVCINKQFEIQSLGEIIIISIIIELIILIILILGVILEYGYE